MKVIVHSLGCRVNQYETDMLAERLNGCSGTGTLHLVNTCTVTSLADRKGRKLIRRLRRDDPDAMVIAIGCQATLAPQSLSRAGADLVVPNRDKGRLPELLPALLSGGRPPSVPREQWPSLDGEQLRGPVARARAPLKIQDGCAGRCSYCLTRQARGPLRSKSPPTVIREARALVEAGHKELVLTGVNLGQYGQDAHGGAGLTALLEKLASSFPEIRFRLSSLGPEALGERLIALLADAPNICPHLHLPLQSGDEAILRRMRRPYTAADYRTRVRSFLDAVPRAAFGTDVLVGFPGEDDSAHQNTMRLLEELKPLNTHVFRFSPRPGTEAASLGSAVAQREAKERADRLERAARGWSLAARAAFLRTEVSVLVERLHCGVAWGHSENYLYVGFPTKHLQRGTITPVHVVYVDPMCVMGVKDNQRDV